MRCVLKSKSSFFLTFFCPCLTNSSFTHYICVEKQSRCCITVVQVDNNIKKQTKTKQTYGIKKKNTLPVTVHLSDILYTEYLFSQSVHQSECRLTSVNASSQHRKIKIQTVTCENHVFDLHSVWIAVFSTFCSRCCGFVHQQRAVLDHISIQLAERGTENLRGEVRRVCLRRDLSEEQNKW